MMERGGGAEHWLAPAALTINWEIVFLWWTVDSSGSDSLPGNCSSWFPVSRTGARLQSREDQRERESMQQALSLSSCFLVSSPWTPRSQHPPRNMFFFFFSFWVSGFLSLCVQRWNEMQQIRFARPDSSCCCDRSLTPRVCQIPQNNRFLFF